MRYIPSNKTIHNRILIPLLIPHAQIRRVARIPRLIIHRTVLANRDAVPQ